MQLIDSVFNIMDNHVCFYVQFELVQCSAITLSKESSITTYHKFRDFRLDDSCMCIQVAFYLVLAEDTLLEALLFSF